MNPSIIALSSAASWGTSDFLGGISARRISPYQTVAIAHGFSLAFILAVIFLLHLPPAGQHTIVFGLIGGLFGGGGLVLFYEALSGGSMGLTAAIGGVLSAAVPVLFGLASEGPPGLHQLLGFVLAIVSIWLISSPPASSEMRTAANKRGLWLGGIAGLCFGTYFVLLKLASAGGTAAAGVLWATAYSRITSSTLAVLLCIWQLRRHSNGPARRWGYRTLGIAAAVGVLDTGGNLLFMLAARFGRMDVAAVLTSLYPAVTILLAAWLLKERTSRSQTLGMALAVGAVALIAA